MRIGDFPCPWHPGMTLYQCKELHEAIDEEEEAEENPS